jgi:cell division protein FtsZ
MPEAEKKFTNGDEDILKFLQESQAKICVIGTGGSGCNTLSRMTEIGVSGAEFIAMNTDAQHLLYTKADRKVLLGKTLTRGLGAGSNPEVGEAAARESVGDLEKAMGDADLVFVTCGLGGGTGTGSAAVIAETAKKCGALTVAVVTLPFSAEGSIRKQNALEGLGKLRRQADTVIAIPNDKLLAIVPDLPLNTAFKISDEILGNAVKGITELVTKPGLVNLDFADLRTVLAEGGCAVIGMGESTGDTKPDQRAIAAVENALKSPLLDADIKNAGKALVNVTGGPDMTLGEAQIIMREVSKRIGASAHIIWGAMIEPEMPRNSIKSLVVITGAKTPDYEKEESGSAELELDYVQ